MELRACIVAAAWLRLKHAGSPTAAGEGKRPNEGQNLLRWLFASVATPGSVSVRFQPQQKSSTSFGLFWNKLLVKFCFSHLVERFL